MCNFKDDILEAACGEPIEAIAVSISRGWSSVRQPDHDLGASPVPWEIAAPVLITNMITVLAVKTAMIFMHGLQRASCSFMNMTAPQVLNRFRVILKTRLGIFDG